MIADEGQPLLSGPVRRKPSRLSLYLFIWGLAASVLLLLQVAPFGQFRASPQAPPQKRNVIFMVSDGMGPASISLARSYRQYVHGLPEDDILNLDQHFIGHSRTRSSDSLITDSAAGATAFSCAHKSYNGAIAMLPDHTACGTLLEAAKDAGYMTGMVVTTRITDATPAAFSAHVNMRWQEDTIAEHQIGDYVLGRSVDLILGGGRCHYLPSSVDGGCRKDKRNLVEEAASNGWTYVDDVKGFKSLGGGQNVSLPLLGLFAPKDIPYDIDRHDTEHPSLVATAKTAIQALARATQDSDKGFFLLIEGSRIDHAAHSNDPAAQVREVLAYDAAFAAAVEFARESSTETIVLSTSDHETGGLATARQLTPDYPEYVWYPEALHNATHSGEYLARKLKELHDSDENIKKYVAEEIIGNGLGIADFTEEELKAVVKNRKNAVDVLNNMVSVRSQTGWSTHGHSAVDVNLYGFGNTERAMKEVHKQLSGSNENTDIGAFMWSYLDVDQSAITKRLKDLDGTGALSVSEMETDDYHHRI
ncbi:repressible alkaline phosphatase [Trichomonascus vanleenenianus]|uniref:alkaline phosphatase PHO8 n=1 Tax=Trichomonascus vanleenenianus TaxID=2268995 RepID=UPI003ECA19E0